MDGWKVMARILTDVLHESEREQQGKIRGAVK